MNDRVAPAWYDWAMAQGSEQGMAVVDGANIEWAAWGICGKPGVLLLTGNGAHIGWWRPIAPFLAKHYRVAALSWSGMGKSDWREAYSTDQFLAEIDAVANAAGLFDAASGPVIVGHSFGGFLTVLAAQRMGDRLSGAVFVDARLRTRRGWGQDAQPVPPFRAYPTRKQAYERFRLQPPQPQDDRWLIEPWADEALHVTPQGWTWRADPDFRAKTELGKDMTCLIAEAKCPLMFVRGELSATVTAEIWQEQKALAPPGTPFIEIPAAHHHVMADQPIALVAVLRTLLAARFRE